jgi:predicted DNA-binding transcriptional regulator AlpA
VTRGCNRNHRQVHRAQIDREHGDARRHTNGERVHITLNSIPKLSELIDHAERVSTVPAEAIPVMLGELERLRVILWVQLTAGNQDGQAQSESHADRLLDVEEAARKLRKSKDYMYRHADAYPFTVRDGRRSVRFSAQGIEKFIRQRMGR